MVVCVAHLPYVKCYVSLVHYILMVSLFKALKSAGYPCRNIFCANIGEIFQERDCDVYGKNATINRGTLLPPNASASQSSDIP